MLEGKKEDDKSQSDTRPSWQRGTVPSEADDSDDIDWDAPPPYEQYFGNDQRNVSTTLEDNGRISMFFGGAGGRYPSLPPLPVYDPRVEQVRSSAAQSYPLLNIVLQVVGSRGDVQPFIALGQELELVGHRVRIATHNVFEQFVQDSGLEFFPIGGDPTELMAYMVKNPGIIPKFATIRAGDISKKRKMISEMLKGCWRSCIDPDPSTGAPFVAEAIIANPPSFAHMHCAQAMGIPVHLMFTMPWTATRAFPHPLANVQLADTDPKTTNFLSYGLVDMMTWQGLGDVVNHWRKNTLNLEPLPAMVGANLANYLKVPFTYCWSSALIPKPFNWPSHIDVCGFFFRNAPDYNPFPELDQFLRAGPPPIYIGFGSIVMEDPHQMTRIILDAVRICGVRAIVSKGWSKLGSGVEHHEDVLFIGDCPHEWLFKHVSAVIHHGGAGTTACGLLNGRPTAIVPFFGDQPFWANMVFSAGAGPRPLDGKTLDASTLATAIETLLHPSTIQAANRISDRMRNESGIKSAVRSFHRNLPIREMHCDMVPRQPATWCWKKGKRTLKLSHRAASILVEHKKIEASSLEIYRPKPISIENRRWDPITATTSAFLDGVVDVGSAFGNLVESPIKEYRKVKSMERENSNLSSLSHSDSSTLSIRSGKTGMTGSSVIGQSAAGAAGKAVGRGFEKVGMAVTKGVIDLPRAVADGLHNVPALYGEEVRDYGEIRGWKSGGKVGVKSMGYGFYDGYVGFFTQPYKGARDGGAFGLVKGIFKGCAGLLTQPGHAIFGVVAYPALGLYRSLNTAHVTGAQGEILIAQKEYGIFLAETDRMDKGEVERVMKDFDEMWLAVREV
ncbi:glycosyltransferase family 1 protein [Hyaloscypha bicolor E]|uniref:Glycosyltransferase family 1 protein n=1 Tax=Hyaloscypha bicolor E TaxID=1095630 RepID=A0A2J6T0X1_9HELO|nr:glycosyltransferase family 1 protein [Hyaloscypha bicolor E]PMD56672.1 glycosyltransferase family 1 protein [Hyaloscypha bicolor E]